MLEIGYCEAFKGAASIATYSHSDYDAVCLGCNALGVGETRELAVRNVVCV